MKYHSTARFCGECGEVYPGRETVCPDCQEPLRPLSGYAVLGYLLQCRREGRVPAWMQKERKP